MGVKFDNFMCRMCTALQWVKSVNSATAERIVRAFLVVCNVQEQ